MTKADIVNEISIKTDINKRLVLKSVEAFMEVIKDSLADGDNIYLRGFGSLVIKKSGEDSKKYNKKYYSYYSGSQYSALQTFKRISCYG